MDTRTAITYELVNPVTDDSIETDSFEEANAYFEEAWIVYEHHVTITRLKYTSTRIDVTTVWNDNPELRED